MASNTTCIHGLINLEYNHMYHLNIIGFSMEEVEATIEDICLN